MPSEHQIEARLLGSRPRRTRLKKGRDQIFGVMFSIPFLLGATGVFLNSLCNIFVAFLGQETTARVASFRYNDRENGRDAYYVDYAYKQDGKNVSTTIKIGKTEYEGLQKGQSVKLRYTPNLPFAFQFISPNETRDETALSWLWPLAISGGVDWAIFYVGYVETRRARRLITNGLPTVGRIVAAQQVKDRSVTYLLKYEYAPVEYTKVLVENTFQAMPRTQESGQKRRAQMWVSKEDGQTVRVGECLIVLFNTDQPRRSIIYRFADYEVVS